MNKTLKLVLILAGSVFRVGLMAASFVAGAAIFGLRVASNHPQIAPANNSKTLSADNDPVLNPQSTSCPQSNPHMVRATAIRIPKTSMIAISSPRSYPSTKTSIATTNSRPDGFSAPRYQK